MVKKLTALILTVIIAFSVFTVTPITVNAVTSGDYSYSVLNDGTAEFTHYYGDGYEISIPSEIDGYEITSIGSHVFCDSIYIGNITVPNSVTSIGDEAFYCCLNLSKVTIPDSVISIGDYAFGFYEDLTIYGNSGSYAETYAKEHRIPFVSTDNSEIYIKYEYNILEDGTAEITNYSGNATELSIPSEIDGYKVTSIGKSAFYNGYALTTIIIPDTVTNIGESAFAYCQRLTTIKIPDSVTSIGDSAFFCCWDLTTITIPNSVTSIGCDAFSGCDILTTVIMSDSVTSIGDSAFFNCYSLKEITIPDSVTSIGESAFAYCYDLTTITIPNLVTSIKNGTFKYCFSLKEIIIPDSVISIGESAFEGCDKLTMYGYNGSCAENYAVENNIPFVVSEYNSSIYRDYKYIILADGTIEIMDYSGSDTEVVIPSEINKHKVVSIGDKAFNDCENLTTITIPDSVTSIGEQAFPVCSSLTTIVYENSYAHKYVIENYIEYKVIILGDINFDSRINVIDATTIQKYSVGKAEFNYYSLEAADVNKDGVINVMDATLVQGYSAGLVSGL